MSNSERVRPGTAGPLLIVAGLAASAIAVAAAPLAMPVGYSWLTDTTSESAAQGLTGAWLARLGFVLFGLSVTALALLRAREWGRLGTTLHYAFGALMISAAAFSLGSLDRTEDVLHSVAATVMGFAFALGIVAARFHARRCATALDVVAVAASVLVPLGMSLWPDVDGMIQRLMFAIAYTWYAAQALRPGLND